MRLASLGLLFTCAVSGPAGDERPFDSNGVKLAYREEGGATAPR